MPIPPVLDAMQKVNSVITLIENVCDLDDEAVRLGLTYLNDVQAFLIPQLEEAHQGVGSA